MHQAIGGVRAALAGVVLLGCLTQGAAAPAPGDVALSLPHPLQDGDRLAVTVRVGPIGRQQIVVRTEAGDRLGTISLFAVPSGQSGGTYVIPVPPGAVRNGTLALRLTIIANGQPRPPTADEVTSIELLQTRR